MIRYLQNWTDLIGILKKVECSDWAAPIVPAMKADGSVRICGDFKVTVNPYLDIPEYPFPTSEELFTKLNGGEKFSKLDLSQAYNQIVLEEESRKYVTINTHQGMYQYTRLPFGIASAPAIFQRTMDTILQGLDKVGYILDDILVTGANDSEHKQILQLWCEVTEVQVSVHARPSRIFCFCGKQGGH